MSFKNLWFQVMFSTFSPYHGCMCVILGHSGINDNGIILLTWMHLYQGKKNKIPSSALTVFFFMHIMSITKYKTICLYLKFLSYPFLWLTPTYNPSAEWLSESKQDHSPCSSLPYIIKWWAFSMGTAPAASQHTASQLQPHLEPWPR